MVASRLASGWAGLSIEFALSGLPIDLWENISLEFAKGKRGWKKVRQKENRKKEREEKKAAALSSIEQLLSIAWLKELKRRLHGDYIQPSSHTE